MDEKLSYWREQYKTAPLAYKPIITTLGKLIKLGNAATTADISPNEMRRLFEFAGVKTSIPDGSYTWDLPAHFIDVAEKGVKAQLNKRLMNIVARVFDAEPAPAVFDIDKYYNAEIDKWLDFLRDVYKSLAVTAPDKANLIGEYGKIVKNGIDATVSDDEREHFELKIVELIIGLDDFKERFEDEFLFVVDLSKCNDEKNVLLLDAIRMFCRWNITTPDCPQCEVYFKPDVDKVMLMFADELGV